MRIKGAETGFYICMNKRGKLIGKVRRNVDLSRPKQRQKVANLIVAEVKVSKAVAAQLEEDLVSHILMCSLFIFVALVLQANISEKIRSSKADVIL